MNQSGEGSAGLDLSLILPVHNEAGSLPSLWEELADAIAKGGWSTEVIFVDDGSTDGGAAIIRSLCAHDPRVRLLRLDKNHGLSAAMDAGLRHARGRVVVTMDSDLQNDPRDIATLLAGLDGWDAVTGWRRDRHDTWLKRTSSRIANGIRNIVMQDSVRDSACSLRAMRQHCLPDLPRFRGFHRFIPNLLRLAGHRVLELPVHHRARQFGVSHYGVRNRALIAFQDLLAVRWMKVRQLRYEAHEEL